jgi:oxygen-independent coproporphyrinogen-3 oxidase
VSEPWLAPRSAYIHIPFCRHKCGYCDFASVANAEASIDDYLSALEAETQRVLGEPREVDTIFIGGGTPTYPSAKQLARLLAIVQRWLPLERAGEWTVESNPNTLDAEKAGLLAAAGVNRVSLGAQSFKPPLLQVLEREHDPEAPAKAMELLRSAGIENLSIDLIFGVPGQTLADWQEDLERTLALRPMHCSTYGLTYEKGTKLWRERRQGVVRPVAEELERAIYEHAIDRLSAAGFAHYEISNFAGAGQGGKPQVCRHNLVYWANHAYWGFGNGAAAYVQGERTLNTRELSSYIRRCIAGESAVTQSERLDDEARARETAVIGLRRIQGVRHDDFHAQTGYNLLQLGGPRIAGLTARGFLDDDGVRLKLTRTGLPVADAVVAEFL